MDSLINVIEPVIYQILYFSLIIIILAFLVKPLLNYFVVNRQIENKKKLLKEIQATCDDTGKYTKTSEETTESNSPTNQEELQRIAAASPEKAEAIVKKMLQDE